MDAAIRADFGHRSTHENLISEAMIVLDEIDHALAHLRAVDAAEARRRRLEVLAGARRRCGRSRWAWSASSRRGITR